MASGENLVILLVKLRILFAALVGYVENTAEIPLLLYRATTLVHVS